MITLSFRRVRWLGTARLLCIGGCATALPVTPNYTVAVGSTLSIRLQTIGPGNPYDSIPQLSSAAVRFVDATQPDSLASTRAAPISSIDLWGKRPAS